MAEMPVPIVRSLIVCEDILTDAAQMNRVSLVNLVNSFRSLDAPPFPHRRSEFCVFVQLSECRRPGTVRLEIREADSDDVIFATQTRTVEFPNNPLTVHGLRFRIRNCQFPSPGLYWVQFICDDQPLSQQSILLRS